MFRPRPCSLEDNKQLSLRETFSELGPAGKVRTVSWQMEQLVDELPLYLLRLNEFSSLIDERMDFGTFKFWDDTQCCCEELTQLSC